MRGLKEIGATSENMHTSGELIHLGLEGESGRLIAGNMGLNLYEVGIGFGHEPKSKRRTSVRRVGDVAVEAALES